MRRPRMTTPDIIGTAEAGRILNRAPQTVVNYINDGRLPALTKIEGGQGKWLLDRADVEKLAQQQETK